MPEAARPLPEESPTLETEHAFPQPAEVHRDYGSIETSGDRFESPLERKQIPGPADGALGENTKYMTALQFATSPLDRLRRAARACPDGDRLRQPDTPSQQLVVIIGLPHQEANHRP